MARCCTAPSSYPERRTVAWLLLGVDGALARPRRRLPRPQRRPWRLTEATPQLHAVSRRPNHPSAPRVPLHSQRTPSMPSPWPGTRRASFLPPTSRATVPSRAGRNSTSTAKLSAGMELLQIIDDAQAPSPVVRPLQRRNWIAGLIRSRQPPRAAYKRHPRARARAHTPPLLP